MDQGFRLLPLVNVFLISRVLQNRHSSFTLNTCRQSRKIPENFRTMTSGDQTDDGECRNSESAKDCLDSQEDNPTPKFSAQEPECLPAFGSLLPPGAVSRPVDEPVDIGACQYVKRAIE